MSADNSSIDEAVRLLDAGRLAEAQALVLQVLRRDNAAAAKAVHILGLIAYRSGNYDAACEWMRASIGITPGASAFHNNLGEVLRSLGRLDEAIRSYQNAITLKSDYAEPHYNMAIAYRYQGRLGESIECYEKALALQPDQAEFHLNLAFSQLLAGDLQRGFDEYEWRWRAPSHTSPRRSFEQPLWQGEDISGRTILLHAEQGFGDTIQFARYVPLVCARGARVILEVQPEVKGLLESLDAKFELRSRGEPLGAFDWHCPLLSLPHALGTTLDTIPAAVPYLNAAAHSVEKGRERIAARSAEGLKVGLVWAGRPTHRNERNRSVRLDILGPLGRVRGIAFIALQHGEAAREADAPPAGLAVRRLEGIADFAETAGVLANLDLLISVDTAIVHLAGAMARPVWLLNPFVTDWRWMLDRADSPWYPTLRIFRQKTHGDWAGVIEEVALALEAHCTTVSTGPQ